MIGKRMSNELVEEIELNIKDAKEYVALGHALDQLEKNKYFKTLIVEGYFKGEAIRLVDAKASPAMQKPEYQEAIIKSIDAIGGLSQYFGKVSHQAEMAKTAIDEGEEALFEMANEGDE